MLTYRITPTKNQESFNIKGITNTFHKLMDNEKIFNKEAFGYEIHARRNNVTFYMVFPDEYKDIAAKEIERNLHGAHFKSHVDDTMPSIMDRERFNSKWFNLYHVENRDHSILPITLQTKNILPNLMDVFERLENDEFVVIQSLFAPLRDEEWKEDFEQKMDRYKKGEGEITSSSVDIVRNFLQGIVKMFVKAIQDIFGGEEDDEKQENKINKALVNNIQKKLNENGYRMVTRIGTYIPVKKQRKEIKREIEKALKLINGDNQLTLQPVLFKNHTTKQLTQRKMPKIRYRGQIYSETELENLIPTPTKAVNHKWIERISIEDREIDERIKNGGFLLGHSQKDGTRHSISLDDKDLDDVSRVLLSIASPGWGKSTMAEALFVQYAKAGHSIFLFDTTSGNLAKRAIELCPSEREQDLIILDSIKDDVIFNMSALGSTDEEISEAFLELFEYAFKTENMHRSSSYLAKLAIAVFSNPKATLLELEKFLDSEEFRDEHLELVRKTNPMIYMWWKNEYPKLRSRVIDIFLPIATRLQLMTSTKKMQNMLCSEGGKIDPYSWMNSGKIVVVNLGEKFKEPQMRLIMSLWNYALWNATLRRGELLREGIEPLPCHAFYDEPQNYMTATPMFDRAISKARKYRMSPKFFIQNAEQIIEQNPSLWKNIVAMNPHLIVGAVSDEMAKRIANDMDVSKEEILAVKEKKHHWVLKTYVKKQAIPPVIFKNYRPEDYFEMTPKPEAYERSRRLYAPHSSEYLQEQIGARRFNLTVEEYRNMLHGGEEKTWEKSEKEEVNEKLSQLPAIM